MSVILTKPWEQMSRNERAALIASMRDRGLSVAQIADLLPVGKSTVDGYIHDPTGRRARERKDRCGGTCLKCGSRTSGADGRAKAASMCDKCSKEERHENRYWTPGRVIDGIQRFALDHGRPPITTDLISGAGIEIGYPELSIVTREFGSWANGMEAAGFERPRTGWKPRGRRLILSVDELLGRVRQASVDGLAPAAWEVSSTYQALRKRGIEWREACAMAGVTPRSSGKQPDRRPRRGP